MKLTFENDGIDKIIKENNNEVSEESESAKTAEVLTMEKVQELIRKMKGPIAHAEIIDFSNPEEALSAAETIGKMIEDFGNPDALKNLKLGPGRGFWIGETESPEREEVRLGFDYHDEDGLRLEGGLSLKGVMKFRVLKLDVPNFSRYIEEGDVITVDTRGNIYGSEINWLHYARRNEDDNNATEKAEDSLSHYELDKDERKKLEVLKNFGKTYFEKSLKIAKNAYAETPAREDEILTIAEVRLKIWLRGEISKYFPKDDETKNAIERDLAAGITGKKSEEQSAIEKGYKAGFAQGHDEGFNEFNDAVEKQEKEINELKEENAKFTKQSVELLAFTAEKTAEKNEEIDKLKQENADLKRQAGEDRDSLLKTKERITSLEEKLKSQDFETLEDDGEEKELENPKIGGFIEKMEKARSLMKEIVENVGNFAIQKEESEEKKKEIKEKTKERFAGILSDCERLVEDLSQYGDKERILKAILKKAEQKAHTSSVSKAINHSEEKIVFFSLNISADQFDERIERFATNAIIAFSILLDEMLKKYDVEIGKMEEIEPKLQELFKEAGLEEIKVDAGKDKYEAGIHEAIRWTNEGKGSEDTILDLVKRGFIFKEKVLKRAFVIVKQ